MKGRRLKVLRVVIGLNQGGVQQGVLNLFRGLDPERFHPIACAIENSGAIGKEIEAAGFEVITLGYKRQALRTILALARLMRERRIDIVHASSHHPSLYARIAGILARVPVLIAHEHTVRDRKRWPRVLLNRLLQPFTFAYIAVGGLVARQVMDWYGYPGEKVHIVHNGVDTERFRPPDSRADAKARVGLDRARPVVAMVCRLDSLKGHRFFFEAIERCPDQDQDREQWLVVGGARNAEEEAAVMQSARQSGVEQRVRFLGLRRDIPELLQAVDIFVFPTLKEGFPNGLLEAMASGCAVVASDWPSNLELIRDGENGLVVAMRDAGGLADAIGRLLDDPVLMGHLGQAARESVEKTFSLQVYARGVESLYDRAMKNRGSDHDRS